MTDRPRNQWWNVNTAGTVKVPVLSDNFYEDVAAELRRLRAENERLAEEITKASAAFSSSRGFVEVDCDRPLWHRIQNVVEELDDWRRRCEDEDVENARLGRIETAARKVVEQWYGRPTKPPRIGDPEPIDVLRDALDGKAGAEGPSG